MKTLRVHITGIVQGVGFRPFVYRAAVARGLSGWVLNAGDGVRLEAQGAEAELGTFIRALRADAPAAARVAHIDVAEIPSFTRPVPAGAFVIVASDEGGARTTLVSPDIATCPDCLRELFDPRDRRYHYPFINCTNCGPRFTIIRALPYDRAATSMDAFPMCDACAAEYADPLDRRFHAQPNACFACGPHLTWREREGASRGDSAASCAGGAGQTPTVGATREASDAIIARAAELIASGGAVAVKGLGGFHLACDATNDAAVRELRHRKRRSNKPLAIMVRTLEDAEGLCRVNETERALLTGTVRPIVLLRRRTAPAANAPRIAPSVAHDLPEIGIMLPYTPLQHLLLAACAEAGVRALVMTSGNLSEEPIEQDDAHAWERLVDGGIADALLGNDRAILARFDDSVVRVVGAETFPVRRARGYAPRPLPLPTTAVRGLPAILACGPEQKATVAIAREEATGEGAARTADGAQCIMSPHIGDIESAETLDAWHEARERLEQLFDIVPTALACDLHPTYLSSQWARATAAECDLPLIEVQHHHAHIAAALAEAICTGTVPADEPVLGIALDGTGAGSDGTVWGGEIMVADLCGFERAGHLATWRLPGAQAAVRDARRAALGLLAACSLIGHPGAQALVASFTATERGLLETMLERGLNSPVTSSAGRLLDAVAALTGVCAQATYEGEPAIALEALAQRAPQTASSRTYRFALREEPCACADAATDAARARVAERAGASQLVLDPAPALANLLDDLIAGRPAPEIARAFHEALADAVATAALRIARAHGIRTAALGGGVFMNRILLQGITTRLEAGGLTVITPHAVPVNDGSIAYGQAAIARARLADWATFRPWP